MPDKADTDTTTTSPVAYISSFWLMQLCFWLGLSLISFFTLTLWYNQVNWFYISHTLLQSLLGVLLSTPLYWVFMRIWERPIVPRGLLSFLAVASLAALWTAARMGAFVWLTPEKNVWRDFGGWYFGSFFIFLCWSGLFHGIRYYQLLQSEHRIMLEAEAVARNEQLKRMKAQAVARDAQMKMLRYQLNPHFLFNTLNAINSLVRLNDSEKAQNMIVQLSKFLRYSLDNNPDIKITLEKEISALMLYLEIEKTRFGERLILDFQIEDQAKLGLVPSLLLQPIIENSMKYAVAKSESGGTICLRASVEMNALILEITDTGPGLPQDKSKLKSPNGRGVGLQNTVGRLKTLYGKQYEFVLDTKPSGGMRTFIKIPYET